MLLIIGLCSAEGADVDSQNTEGYTAVSLACALNKPDLVNMMIKRYKADVNIPNLHGECCGYISICDRRSC